MTREFLKTFYLAESCSGFTFIYKAAELLTISLKKVAEMILIHSNCITISANRVGDTWLHYKLFKRVKIIYQSFIRHSTITTRCSLQDQPGQQRLRWSTKQAINRAL